LPLIQHLHTTGSENMAATKKRVNIALAEQAGPNKTAAPSTGQSRAFNQPFPSLDPYFSPRLLQEPAWCLAEQEKKNRHGDTDADHSSDGNLKLKRACPDAGFPERGWASEAVRPVATIITILKLAAERWDATRLPARCHLCFFFRP
jgi:hypothetical protein